MPLEMQLEQLKAALVVDSKALEKDGALTFEEVEAEEVARQAAWEMISKVWDSVDSLRLSIQSILADEDVANKGAKISESVDQFRDALQGSLAKTVHIGVDDDGKGKKKKKKPFGKAEPWSTEMTITKVDEDKRLVFGFFSLNQPQ